MDNKKRNEFFAKTFNKLLEEWKENQPKRNRSDEAFANAIKEAGKSSKITCRKSTVGTWKKGEHFPTQYISLISKVFGVKEDIFFPQSQHDQYVFDEVTQNKVIQKIQKLANEEYLINPAFFYFIRENTDFDTLLPIWSNLEIIPANAKLIETEDGKYHYEGDFLQPRVFARNILSEACPVSDRESKLFQVEKENKVFTLSEVDIAFIKEIQDTVIEVVKYKYFERAQQMKEAETQATKLLNRNEGGFSYEKIPSREELLALEPYVKEVDDRIQSRLNQSGEQNGKHTEKK